MPGQTKKIAVQHLLPLLLLLHVTALGQTDRQTKVIKLYSSMKQFDIACPKTCLAIAIFETGWMECKNCAFQYNNLFGFGGWPRYMHFNSIEDCVAFLKKWQDTYYQPWKIKHPTSTYYQFWVHMNYTGYDMTNYIKKIKSVERYLAKDLETLDRFETTPQQVEPLTK